MKGRLYISAAHKSSGKTTLAVGLCAALRQYGRVVQPFKKGPDYIDPMWLGLASGRPCYNLDFHTQSPVEICRDLAARSQGADLALIEGTKGLFDDVDPAGSTSNAALSRLTGTPVVLVIDCEGVTRGIAPLLLGYRQFEPDTPIVGVILNKVGGERHERKLRTAVANYTDLMVFGAVAKDSSLAMRERHLGLLPANEDVDAGRRIDAIAARIRDQVDLAAIEAMALGATPLQESAACEAIGGDDAEVSANANTDGIGRIVVGNKIGHHGATLPLSIGVLRDRAFGFYYPGDLDAMVQAGAELIMIDAISDGRLPSIDGLFIGGGFPETQMEALAVNRELRREIYAAVEGGLPVYAECGGLIYLSRSLRWGDRYAEMVGVLAADTIMCERPQGRGYVELEETGYSPWPSLRPNQGPFPAHEFHYSRLENITGTPTFAFRVKRGAGIRPGFDGWIHKNTLACYAHLRHVDALPWTTGFLQFVSNCRRHGVLRELAAAVPALVETAFD